LSVAGAVVFLWEGVVRHRLRFRWARNGRSAAGLALLLFALAVYPAWSSFSGHRYPELPTFGLPCPTTLFTLGLLAFLEVPYPRGPLMVPIAWCFVGAQAAFMLDFRPDLGLLFAGAFGLLLLARSRVSGPAPRSMP